MAFTNLIKNMFMTPGQKKATEDAYYKKMYPFKAEQQNWENEILSQLFDNDKKLITIKYLCLVRREMYIDGNVCDDLNNPAIVDYVKLIKRMKISKSDETIIDVFAKLEARANSIEEMPTIVDIRKEIENELGKIKE